MVREKVVTKAAERAPSAKRSRSRLGTRKAMMNASIAKPAPKKVAKTCSRTNPKILLPITAMPTIPAERATDCRLRPAGSSDCGLRIADCGSSDCGLRIADCGLRIADCGSSDCGIDVFGFSLSGFERSFDSEFNSLDINYHTIKLHSDCDLTEVTIFIPQS